jgi:uncharacterized integral membrane protein
MNKGKLVWWLLILGFMALGIYQNQDYFLKTTQSLRLNFLVVPEYHTPNLPLAAIHLVFFVFGLLVAFLLGLPTRFRARKAIRHLSVSVDAQEKEMSELKSELARLKGEPLPGDGSGQSEASITSPVKHT